MGSARRLDQGTLPLKPQPKHKPEKPKEPPLPKGTKEPALILGGADCVWDDLRRLEEMLGFEWPWTVIAINDIGCVFPRKIDHWCTLHPEKLPRWMDLRKKNGHPDGYVTWTRDNRIRRTKSGDIATTHRKTPSTPFQGGASGMLAAAVAIEVGAKVGAFCGVPMTNTPHFTESAEHKPGKNWPGAGSHWKAWQREPIAGKLRGRFCSMSGNTMKLLGECYRCLLTDCEKAA